METLKTNKLTKLNNEKVRKLDLNISNLVLTPLTCASLISEILKCLIYEKSQIPYPYNWLRNIILTKRKQNAAEASRNKNVFIEKQYRVACAAFDTVEEILGNIKRMFKFGNNISEIIVLLGATPLNPKEIYKFSIPTLARGHVECNHHNITCKHQHKILRSLFMSEEWMSKMEQSLPLTNLHVFLKMRGGDSVVIDNRTMNAFIPSASYAEPKSAQSLTVNLFYDDHVSHNCCSNLTVYEDTIIEGILQQQRLDASGKAESSEDGEDRFQIDTNCVQANCVLKGFRESSVNNVPVSHLW